MMFDITVPIPFVEYYHNCPVHVLLIDVTFDATLVLHSQSILLHHNRNSYLMAMIHNVFESSFVAKHVHLPYASMVDDLAFVPELLAIDDDNRNDVEIFFVVVVVMVVIVVVAVVVVDENCFVHSFVFAPMDCVWEIFEDLH